jgi:hypothetical protein
VHVSSIVQAEKTLLSNSSNNELLILNLATVSGRKNSKLLPAQSRKTLAASKINNDTQRDIGL